MERKWTGKWIKGYNKDIYFQPAHPAPYLRTAFNIPETFSNAVVHLCGLGLHELYVNGEKADDRWYSPGLSQYDWHAGYVDYNVTKLLHPGKNMLVVLLGNGYYNCRNNWKYSVNFSSWRAAPKMVCDVEIDGRIVEASGVHWRVHSSPVVYDSHFEGEDYDARLEIPECFQPEFDDVSWLPAFRAIPPGGILELEEGEPCRVLKRFLPVKVNQLAKDRWVYDFGINIAGCCEIKVSGPAGTTLTFRYGEMLDNRGELDTRDIASAQRGARFQTDHYTLKGGGLECWHPRFVWHGFQFVEVTISDLVIELHQLEALFIGSDLESTGSFCCSHPILNRIQELTLTSYRANFMSIPTDCPTREKFGWTGDASIGLEPGMWNFAPRRGYERLLQIILDIQRPNGCLSTHGPTTLWGFEESCPCEDCFVFRFCRLVYEFDGDANPIRRYYPKMKKVIEFNESVADDGLIHFGFGDCWDPAGYDTANGSLPRPFHSNPIMTETVFWYENIKTMERFATLLGYESDRLYYAQLAAGVAESVHRHFYDEKTGLYDNGLWASNGIALCSGIVPEKQKTRTAAALVKLVRDKKHRTLAGVVGARYVPRALAENGYAGDAFEMFVQTDYPGWGYWVTHGASSLWELWNGRASRNHVIFSDVSAWAYRYLAGISPLSPGFRQIELKPCFVPQLDSFEAEHRTPYGILRSAWRRKERKILCSFDIPEGSEATIRLPCLERQGVTGQLEICIPTP